MSSSSMPELAVQSSVSAIFASRKRILSVDDDPINQLVIQTCLEPEGYEVFQAMDGFEALQFLSSSKLPDAMLLDVMMPGMSGYEVCEEVRRLYGWRLPIVMISAKGKKEDIVAGLSKGCNDYIVKPFDKTELLCRLEARIKLNILPELKHNLLNKQTLVNKLILNPKIQQTPNNHYTRIHALCIKHALNCQPSPPLPLSVTKLTADSSQVLAFSDSLADLVTFADQVMRDSPAARAGIATGALDTVLVDNERVLAFVGVGPALQQAQELAETAVLATIALCDETIKAFVSTAEATLKAASFNAALKLIAVMKSSKVDSAPAIQVSSQVAATLAEVTRLLDCARFASAAESLTDERVTTVMKVVENKHSTKGDADEAQTRANLHAALDKIQATDANADRIGDEMIAVARFCSALFALGRTGGVAADSRIKERVEHLTQWLNEISAQFAEARKAAELTSPLLVALEAEFAQISQTREKLSLLRDGEKSLVAQAEQLVEQLEIVNRETLVTESQVAAAYAEIVRASAS